MADPFNDLNSAMRDRDHAFTKREYIAMQVLTATMPQLDLAKELELSHVKNLCITACKTADILLESLRTVR